MCPASTGASSATKPVSTFTTPPGRSEVASTSASVIAGSGRALAGDHHRGVPGGDHRRDDADQPEQAGPGRRHDRDHAGRLRHAEVEERPGHRVRRPGHLGHLVRPPRVPDPAVDRGRHGPLRLGEVSTLARGDLGGELRRPALQHLGHPVEDLAAVVGGRAGPAAHGGPRGLHRVSRVLARRLGGVGQQRSVRAGHRVGPARLRPRERAADEQLVGLADVQPADGCRPAPRVAAAFFAAAVFFGQASRYAARPCRPPSRPKPDSRYPPNGLAGSNRL